MLCVDAFYLHTLMVKRKNKAIVYIVLNFISEIHLLKLALHVNCSVSNMYNYNVNILDNIKSCLSS